MCYKTNDILVTVVSAVFLCFELQNVHKMKFREIISGVSNFENLAKNNAHSENFKVVRLHVKYLILFT